MTFLLAILYRTRFSFWYEFNYQQISTDRSILMSILKMFKSINIKFFF